MLAHLDKSDKNKSDKNESDKNESHENESQKRAMKTPRLDLRVWAPYLVSV